MSGISDVTNQSDYHSCSAGEAASGPRAARGLAWEEAARGAACGGKYVGQQVDVRGAREQRRQRADSSKQRSDRRRETERVEENEESTVGKSRQQSRQQSKANNRQHVQKNRQGIPNSRDDSQKSLCFQLRVLGSGTS